MLILLATALGHLKGGGGGDDAHVVIVGDSVTNQLPKLFDCALHYGGGRPRRVAWGGPGGGAATVRVVNATDFGTPAEAPVHGAGWFCYGGGDGGAPAGLFRNEAESAAAVPACCCACAITGASAANGRCRRRGGLGGSSCTTVKSRRYTLAFEPEGGGGGGGGGGGPPAPVLRRVVITVVFAYRLVENATVGREECARRHNRSKAGRHRRKRSENVVDAASLFHALGMAEDGDAHARPAADGVDVLLFQTATAHYRDRTSAGDRALMRRALEDVTRRAARWQWRWPQRRGPPNATAYTSGGRPLVTARPPPPPPPQRLALFVETLPQHFCWSEDGGYRPGDRGHCLPGPGRPSRGVGSAAGGVGPHWCAPLLNATLANWRNALAAPLVAARGLGHLRLADAFAPMHGAHVSNQDCTHYVYSDALFAPFFERLWAHLAHRFGDVYAELPAAQ